MGTTEVGTESTEDAISFDPTRDAPLYVSHLIWTMALAAFGTFGANVAVAGVHEYDVVTLDASACHVVSVPYL